MTGESLLLSSARFQRCALEGSDIPTGMSLGPRIRYRPRTKVIWIDRLPRGLVELTRRASGCLLRISCGRRVVHKELRGEDEVCRRCMFGALYCEVTR
jgi:hypothetical protein